MAKKQITIKTDKHEYIAETLPALTGAVILKDIVKLVSPSLGEGVDNASGQSFSGFTGIAEQFVKQLDNVDAIQIIETLHKRSNVFTDNKPVNFDDHYSANYDELLAVTQWLIEENFGTFFTKARSLLLSMNQ